MKNQSVPMETPVLRPWRDSDFEPYAAMNADPEVMRYFPAPLSREASKSSFQRMRQQIEDRGWGLWAVDVDGVFAGLTGLNVPAFAAPFTPCTEIAWRFRKEFWGRGLATMAARQALRHGFETLRLAEIVSFTAAANVPSRKLMERLGFDRDAAEDFDHPALPEGHILRPHVLYRMKTGVIQSLHRSMTNGVVPAKGQGPMTDHYSPQPSVATCPK